MAKFFVNAENKVLTSDGKIRKSSYEFGSAFQNRMGLNNYIQISGLSLTQYNTVISICGNFLDATYNQFCFNLQNTNLDNFNYTSETTGARYLKYLKNSGGANQAANFLTYVGATIKRMIIGAIIRDTNINSIINGDTLSNQTSVQTNQYTISKVWIGAVRLTNGATPSDYTNASVKQNRLIIYNREISSNELKYLYNNGLCNDLQSLQGLEIDIIFNKAEILDFSPLQNGTDVRVGCRDYSGFHRHGEIINLPAGTLQQKVDYANANLFVPFI